MDTTTRERLIRLRLLLDEAQGSAGHRTHIGRPLATVMLDGACEYAMGLARRKSVGSELRGDEDYRAAV